MNVRYWAKADIPGSAVRMSDSGGKRTFGSIAQAVPKPRLPIFFFGILRGKSCSKPPEVIARLFDQERDERQRNNR